MDTKLSQEDWDTLRLTTEYISTVIRYALQDFHHKYPSDEQMNELNPIIRNAIYTALYARETLTKSVRSEDFVRKVWKMLPRYWEEPEFIKEFKK